MLGGWLRGDEEGRRHRRSRTGADVAVGRGHAWVDVGEHGLHREMALDGRGVDALAVLGAHGRAWPELRVH